MFILSAFINCQAQINHTPFYFDNFEEQILAFQPQQNDLQTQSYNHSMMILRETKSAVKNDIENFTAADYLNVLSCFLTLNQTKKNIDVAYEKLKRAEGSCEFFLYARTFQSDKYDIIRDQIEKQVTICKKSVDTASPPLDLLHYANENKLNENLIRLIDKVDRDDNRYRTTEPIDWSRQTPLDQTNQLVIDSLYNSHQTYIGTSLVGEKFSHVMWSVIQHSNVDMMERYLPVLQKAVEQKNLNVTPFKMLLDRYHGLKYGYQLFGSQSGFGFELADEKTRKDIEKKYKLH